MSKTNNWENDVLAGLFTATALANIFDNAASSPVTSLYLSLHTSDPGEAGDQTTNECAYTSYARVAIARSGSGFTVSGNQVTLASPPASFPACTGGTETATHFGVGKSSSGTGRLFYKGALSPTIAISSGVTPKITPTITED